MPADMISWPCSFQPDGLTLQSVAHAVTVGTHKYSSFIRFCRPSNVGRRISRPGMMRNIAGESLSGSNVPSTLSRQVASFFLPVDGVLLPSSGLPFHPPMPDRRQVARHRPHHRVNAGAPSRRCIRHPLSDGSNSSLSPSFYPARYTGMAIPFGNGRIPPPQRPPDADSMSGRKGGLRPANPVVARQAIGQLRAGWAAPITGMPKNADSQPCAV